MRFYPCGSFYFGLFKQDIKDGIGIEFTSSTKEVRYENYKSGKRDGLVIKVS